MAILKTKELMKKFNIGSQETMLGLLRSKGSPAIFAGNKWMCDEDKFEQYLIDRSSERKS